MHLIIRNIKWVMLASGVVTSTMFLGLFAPEAALASMFGTAFSGTLESIVVRSWSSLVGLMGVVLIYGAFSEKHRAFALCIASISKAIFIALLLVYGREYLEKAAPALLLDGVTVCLAVVYLLAIRAGGCEPPKHP